MRGTVEALPIRVPPGDDDNLNPDEDPTMQSRPKTTVPHHLPRTLLGALGAVVALGLIVFAPQWASNGGGLGAVAVATADAGPAERAAIGVRVLTVSTREGTPDAVSLRATGTLRARRHAPLAFAVGGVVEAMSADEGNAVAAGAVLARLDAVPFDSAVRQARARVDYLGKSLARSRSLLDQKALSAEEYDAQAAELEGARAQLRLAEWNLERAVLRAPFDGHLVERHVELGQVVAAGTLAFELIELRRLEVDAALPAGDLGRVDFDGVITVRTTDGSAAQSRGRIDHAPVKSDTRSGTVPLEVVVDNADLRLLPGMVVEVEFATRTDDALTAEIRVPLSALRLDDRGQSVWRVHDGRVRLVPVELGPVRGDQVVIRRGLSVGDRIVDEAPDRLREGDAVIEVTEASR